LGTGIAFSFREKNGTIYACSILSAPPLRKASALHNTRHGVVKDAVHEIVGVPDNRIGETLDVPLRAPGKWTSLFRRTIHHRRNGASSPLEKTGLSRSDFLRRLGLM
jgi:hypothetical protein